MAKSITVQRKILKINSKDIRAFTEMDLISKKDKTKNISNCKWKYEIDWKKEENSENVISLGESNTLRMLDDILGDKKDIRNKYEERKKAIKLKRSRKEPEDSSYLNKTIKQIYNEIDELQFQENYIAIIFNTKADFKTINKNGLELNGKSFKRLYGTTSGVKENVVVYVCNDKLKSGKTIHEELLKRLENDYNKEVGLIPSKFEAYLSLNSSASTPVFSEFKANEILVIPDQVNEVRTKATLIGECEFDEPIVLENQDYLFELEQSDGGGIIDKSISDIWAEDLELDYTPSVFITRNSFLKGTLGTMEISEAVKRYKDEIGDVYDVWNLRKPLDERKKFDISNVKMIIPTSMLKLWRCYDGIDDYLKNCEKNKHTFSVTKTSPKKLENERTLNYQFVQSLFLDDKAIDGLTSNTIKAFHDILRDDFTKAILYSKGTATDKIAVSHSDNDCFKAMMIDKRMMDDIFVKKTIYKMMKNAIDKAKIAKIKTRGNYQMIIPDLVSFFKHSVGMTNTEGVLKEGEFYSQYWNNLGVQNVVAMRAPACTHANFRKLKFIDGVKDIDLLKHIKTAIVFNGYDATAEAISGADKQHCPS